MQHCSSLIPSKRREDGVGIECGAKWGHSPGGHSPGGGNGNDSFGCQNGNRGMRPVFRGKWHVFRGKWRHFRGKIGIPPIPTHSPRPGNRGIFPPFPQLLGEWPHLDEVVAAGSGKRALSGALAGGAAGSGGSRWVGWLRCGGAGRVCWRLGARRLLRRPLAGFPVGASCAFAVDLSRRIHRN